jgi:hypothetical protein
MNGMNAIRIILFYGQWGHGQGRKIKTDW